jgi:hypothetical protein
MAMKMFDPKKEYSYGEMLDHAMKITKQADADEYTRRCCDWHVARGMCASNEEARGLFLGNLGYWTGYYGGEEAARTMRLFKTSHPIFGTARPTSKEALAAGKRMARKTR